MTHPETPLIAVRPVAEEKVGLRCIKVTDRRQRAMAVVRNFFAADKPLCGWASRAAHALECQFEIVYDDGHVVHGNYHFSPKGCKRPDLRRYLRAGGADATANVEQRTAFLERYETDDFGDSA